MQLPDIACKLACNGKRAILPVGAGRLGQSCEPHMRALLPPMQRWRTATR